MSASVGLVIGSGFFTSLSQNKDATQEVKWCQVCVTVTHMGRCRVTKTFCSRLFWDTSVKGTVTEASVFSADTLSQMQTRDADCISTWLTLWPRSDDSVSQTTSGGSWPHRLFCLSASLSLPLSLFPYSLLFSWKIAVRHTFLWERVLICSSYLFGWVFAYFKWHIIKDKKALRERRLCQGRALSRSVNKLKWIGTKIFFFLLQAKTYIVREVQWSRSLRIKQNK